MLKFRNQRSAVVSRDHMTWLSLLLATSCGATVLLGGYRIVWRRRFGAARIEGRCLGLRGRVAGPGGRGTVVGRASPGGDVRVTPFELQERSGQRRRVETSGANLTLRGTIRVGDPVTVHALPTTVLLAEAGYRQSALQHAVAAVHLVRGAWPELRGFDLFLVVAALAAAGSATLTLAPGLLAGRLDCPPHAALRGAQPPLGVEQWCELALPAGLTQQHGPYVRWHAGGQVEVRGALVHGKREGKWLTWHPTGRLATRGNFREGRAVGRHASWLADGQLREREEHSPSGVQVGVAERFSSRGRLEWRLSHALDGEADGAWVEWHPAGGIRSRITYRRGKLDGPFHTWNAEGRLVEAGAYRHGAKHGQWAAWDDAGRLLRRGLYRANVRHGPWRFWNAGVLLEQGSYRRGLAVDTWSYWHRDGGWLGHVDWVPAAIATANSASAGAPTATRKPPRYSR